ncbi:hypothetical protein [Actinacidiphila oryziradicis]|uniref:hypothetical protein n=1 Tax=Actinacidiphila oryziradicis TaxID=2571141 RepID=UPI0010AD6482|nr:hypothetical protein [Actinacidiphila oryziradicis]
MEIRPQDTRTDARRIGTQVARELQTRFAAAGFRLDIHGASPISGRATWKSRRCARMSRCGWRNG